MPDLVKDDNGNPIQALRTGALVNQAVGAGSTLLTIPAGAEVVEISNNTPVWIRFGDSGVTVTNSTGHYLPAGNAVYAVSAGQTHLAHIQDTAAGRLALVVLE